MPVMHKPLALAALCLAAGLCVPGPGQAQNYIGGANVVVNLRALDQLGPAPSAGSPYSTFPQSQPGFSAGGTAPKPLLGDSGGNVKLRPPRPSRGAVAATGSAEPLLKSESVDASRPRSRAERPAQQTAAASPPPVTITLPPPVAPTPGPAPVAGRPLALPSAQPPSAQPPSAQPPSAQPPSAQAPSVQPPVQAAPQAPVATAALPQATPAPSAPAPVPAPAPAASNPATQQSALLAPPPVAARGAGDLVMTFEAGKSELPGAASPQLEALAKQLAGNEERVQIRAYASANGADAASGARRLSLSRALAVRTYLIDRGVRSTRIDVRALGAPTDGSPVDRVEVATIGR